MNEKEKLIREQRYIEATRKGLTGMEGKFGCILRQLGQPIVSHGGAYFESNPMEDVYDLPKDEENKIEEMDEDQPVMEMGYIFDGLTSGLHLEIKYITDSKELRVNYKGYPVYMEIGGELECYVPSPEWEEKVDRLYGIAKEREMKVRKQQSVENREEARRQKVSWLERMRLRWGI